MSTGLKPFLLTLAAMLAVLDALPVSAAKPPLCTAGRFAVAGAPLLGPGGEVVVLADETIAIGNLCAARKAKLARKKNGTSVQLTFKKGGCAGVDGKVKDVKISSPAGLKPVHDCIKRAVSLWRFPGGPDAYATSFTLVLQGG